jgi:molecular chaperone DnaK (HSP70)
MLRSRRVGLLVFGGVALVLLVAPMLAAAHTSVVGVDLGSEFIKVCAAKKDHTIDIVLNEQTRRKSNHYVGFRGDDRYVGEDARNLAARFPLNMFAMLNRVAGLGFDKPEDRAQLEFYSQELQFPYHMSAHSRRGTVQMSIPSNPNVTHSVEELLSMIFAYIKDITEKDTEAPPRSDCDMVVTVPHYFNARQRQAYIDAANLAGCKIVGALHPTTATALYFGMSQQGFGNETKHVLIYDMGSTKTEVGVFTFSAAPPPPPGEKRVKLAYSLGTMTTRYIASDSTLGGRTFDNCLAMELVRQFKAAHPKLPSPLNGTTLAQFKSSFSLFRAANNLKEQLSANTAAPINVEGIAPEKDFQTKVSREEFETLCAPLFQRAVRVAQEAIEKSGLKAEELHRFELMGGGSRLPKLITELSAMYGKPVDRTLNTDESAAMGAAYFSASKAGFRVRSFEVNDPVPQTYQMVLSPKPRDQTADPEASKGKPPAPRDLFVNARPGSVRSITVKREDDFSIFLRTDEGKHEFAEVQVTGVRSTLEALDALNPTIPHENNTHAIRIELKISAGGIVAVSDALVKVTYAANVSRRVRVQQNETESSNSTEGADKDGDKDGASEGNENKDSSADGKESEPTDTKTSTDGSEANATDANGESANSSGSKAPVKQWVTTYRIEMKRKTRNLQYKLVFNEQPLPLDTEDVLAGKAMLAAMEAADEKKRLLAASKNDLEAYIQSVKGDGLLEHPEIAQLGLLNDTLKESITAAAAAAQTWLEEGEGSYDSTTKEQFDEQLRILKEATAPVTEPFEAHRALQAEIHRNATLAKKKAAEEAAKKAKKEKNKKTGEKGTSGETPSGDDAKTGEEKKSEEQGKEESQDEGKKEKSGNEGGEGDEAKNDL